MRSILLGMAALASLAATARAEGVASTADDRSSVQVTVYNQDLALVREVRDVELPAGRFAFEFRDVPSGIRPASLLVTAGDGFSLLEQNYEYDLMSREKILEKYVGRSVAWLQEDGSRVEGRLLGMTGGPVYQVDGEIVFEVPGRLALPELPETLRARPTLVWLADAGRSGTRAVEASYLTGGLSWQADYVLEVGADDRTADLLAWVTVDNRSGAGFADAELALVAGDINVVRPTLHKALAMEAGFRAPAADAAFERETLHDYHLYSLQRPTTLLNNQTKQIALFEASGVEVERKYRLEGQLHHFRSHGGYDQKERVAVRYELENAEDNGLGHPLPGGTVRVYGRSGDGSRRLLGEDAIAHTPRDETVRLTTGYAFDLTARRVRTEGRRLGDNAYRQSFEITVRNHKEEDVVVEIVEPFGGEWRIERTNLEPRRLDARTAAFDLPVPAGGEARLIYTVEVQY